MAEQLAKIYDPKSIEKEANEIWNKGQYFHAEPAGKGKTYTIVIPPPNVTAALHLGHALNNTLQDILVRMRRMQKYNTLWMPGTDHAGIATQTVVEKRILAEEGKRRTDFTREVFVKRIQAWKDEYETTIIGQLKAMGCSCDWPRTRFTMDAVCAKAVRAAFFKLFKDGLIYRGKRLVNWDPATQTVLADDEVEHESIKGNFWYLKYPLEKAVEAEGKVIEHVTVATTRPETMLGDTAVAMNPADERAKYLVGKKIRLPIVGRMIPIIADEHVVLANPESEDEKARFSTGFLKVTPAHDPDDWEIGLRHKLEVINVMAPDGTISDKHGWNDARGSDAEFLLGMDRFEAREAIVEWFRQEGLLEEIRDYTHEVGHSYRSHVPIEPYLSDQWYIAVKKPIEHLAEKFGQGMIDGTDVPKNSLAGLALSPLVDGRLRIIPERYGKTYRGWVENLRDWPISRQLWWGHQIPVWALAFNTAHMLKSENEPDDAYKKEYIKLLDDFLESCKIKNDVDYHQSDEPINHSCFSFYLCAQSPKAQNALDLLSKIVKHHSTSKVEEVKKYSNENQEFEKAFSKDTLTKARELSRKLVSLERDPDVLDTWFSSALWPFSTLGWPEESADLKTYYPGNVLCTAREIITLWVSRMVMMGQYCAGNIPFSEVFIHAMIQDGEGRKMSKSLGNGIDPLAVIDSHGADAMRITVASMTTETQDIRMPVTSMKLPDGRTANTSPKFDIGRNFCNKLWNASRFAMMNLEGMDANKFDKSKMSLTDKWILSRLMQVIKQSTDGLDNFKFSEPFMEIYRFFWNDFCDWYLEWAKPRMNDEGQKAIAQNVLAFVLDEILRLLHPFAPFITEGIFQKLNELAPVRSLKGVVELEPSAALIAAEWPKAISNLIDTESEQKIEAVQKTIKMIRDIRSTYNIAPSKALAVSVKTSRECAENLNENCELIKKLGNINKFAAGTDIEKPQNAAAAMVDDIQIYVHDVIDPKAEIERFEKQRQEIEKNKKGIEAKLANENFVQRAKAEVVAQTREKLSELTEQLKAVEKHLSELKV